MAGFDRHLPMFSVVSRNPADAPFGARHARRSSKKRTVSRYSATRFPIRQVRRPCLHEANAHSPAGSHGVPTVTACAALFHARSASINGPCAASVAPTVLVSPGINAR